MATINGKLLKFLMGTEAGISKSRSDNGYVAAPGEILITTDTKKFYVCDGNSALIGMNAFHADAATKTDKAMTINLNGEALWSFNGSVAKTINLKNGTNIAITKSGNDVTITGPSSLKNPQVLRFENSSTTYDGSSEVRLTPEMLGLGNAMYFRGVANAKPTAASVTLKGQTTAITCASGDVVFHGGIEYIFDGSTWHEMGNEGSHALKSVTVSGDGTYIKGSGTLASDIRLTHETYSVKAGTAGTSSNHHVVSSITTNNGGHITGWTSRNIFEEFAKLTIETSTTQASAETYSVEYTPGAAKTMTIYTMKGASETQVGFGGLVPAPDKGSITRFLAADGTWVDSVVAGSGISVRGNTVTNSGVRAVTKHTTNGSITVNTNGTDAEVKVYSLPKATSSILGGVKIGSNITVDDGTISITAGDVRTALGNASVQDDGGYVTKADYDKFSSAYSAVIWGSF